MTYEQATERAKRMLAKRTMAQLIADWELTERELTERLENRSKVYETHGWLIDLRTGNLEVVNPDVYDTRGWLMDEFERRDPEAFDAWLEAYDASPRDFFKVA